MSQRDTPWDLIFGAPGFDESRLELLREQDDRRSTTPTELFMLAAAGDLLRDLLPPEESGGEHGEVVAQVSALMFHAYRFWLHGRRVYRLGTGVVARLLEGEAAAADWRFVAPGPAGYVQLPRNALWARVADDATPEPVDGFFWSAPAAEDGPHRLDLLLVLGMRAGRPGVSVVAAGAEGENVLDRAAGADARPGGVDFANILPGGELQGYHALATQAEAVKLAALCFRHIDAAGRAEASAEGQNVVVVLEE